MPRCLVYMPNFRLPYSRSLLFFTFFLLLWWCQLFCFFLIEKPYTVLVWKTIVFVIVRPMWKVYPDIASKAQVYRIVCPCKGAENDNRKHMILCDNFGKIFNNRRNSRVWKKSFIMAIQDEEYILKWNDHKTNFFSLMSEDLFQQVNEL